VRSQLRNYPLIYTQQGKWVYSSEAFLLEKGHPKSAKILEKLEIPLVHDDLRSYFGLLRSEDVGVKLVTVSLIADALKRKGLTQPFNISEAPLHFLRSDEGYRAFWTLLDNLPRQGLTTEEREALRSCAVARCWDGKLWPLDRIFQAEDEETIELFSIPPFNVSFLDQTVFSNSFLKELVLPFTLEEAISLIQSISSDELEQSWKEGQWDPRQLCRWFENRKRELLRDLNLRKSFTALAILPAGGHLHPLKDLVLPGDFRDPLGLTEVVDLNILEGCRDFLRELGMVELTFITYAREHIPRAFTTRDLPPETRRALLTLLAQRLGEIRDQSDIREKLGQCPLVECIDGEFREPTKVYLDNEVTRLIFGDSIFYARLPSEGRESLKELFQWLGVASEPRLEDVVQRIFELAQSLPSDQSVEAVQIFFEYLGDVWRRKALDPEERKKLEKTLLPLKSLCWLPVEGDRSRWYCPHEVYAAFRRYLFETQAQFLGMPRKVQDSSADFMSFLQIQTEPTTSQVVRHLLQCAEQCKPVNKEVFNFLNQNADEPDINLLKGKPCLLLPDGRYVRPGQVFWGEHPFGRYRYRLSDELLQYKQLFDRLGVKEHPEPSDATAVILQISDEFGPANRPLDEEAYSVLLKSWEVLSRAITEEENIQAEIQKLAERKTIPDDRWILNPPERMFFEDRPGLTQKFKGLEHNVIPRPEGAWPAMSEAGVRPLSKAAQTHLLECDDPTPDGDLTKRLRERRHLLIRIVDPYRVKSSSDWDTSILERLTCYRSKRLVIQHAVKAFMREFSTEPEEISALCHQDVLYYSTQNGERPWLAIGREIAFAMNPSPEAGSLAAALKETLAAPSAQDAEAILDQSGVPPLQGTVSVDKAESEIICALGGEQSPQEPMPQEVIPSAEETPKKEQQEPLIPAGTAEDAVREILGEDLAESVSPEKPQMPGHSPIPSVARTRDSRSVPTRHGRFRTYPIYESSCKTDGESVSRRSDIEQAGVERVKEYERKQGRDPKEMSPNHPGYDIESLDPVSGKVVRYIEVKALSAEWTSLGVGLTTPQFETAKEKGEHYWLYVVERADQDDYHIILIQDPACKVNEFLYDDGWKKVASEIYSPDGGANGSGK